MAHPDEKPQIVPARLRPFYERINHGDYPDWLDAVGGLPEISPSLVRLDTDTIRIGAAPDCSASQRAVIHRQLRRLLPWRKGPFNLFGLDIDAEWRSDMKWRRLREKIAPLSGRTVLDVGCGNGYYGWRMLGAGAKRVVGIDPALRCVMQQRAMARYLPRQPFDILPLSLEALAQDAAGAVSTGAFDTVFSMGVIYHRRDPVGHLRELSGFLRPGGELVLESLIIDARFGALLKPRGRYAKMPNVRSIPSIDTLKGWLSAAGLGPVNIADISVTTPVEQRVTDWTFGQSLADFLDPRDPALTIEGYPAPKRAMVIVPDISLK